MKSNPRSVYALQMGWPVLTSDTELDPGAGERAFQIVPVLLKPPPNGW